VLGEAAGVVVTACLAALDGELDEAPHAPATTTNERARPTWRNRVCMCAG